MNNLYLYFWVVGKGRGAHETKVPAVPSHFHGGRGKSSVMEQTNETDEN